VSGKAMIGVDYDALDSAPASFVDFMAMKGSVEEKASFDFRFISDLVDHQRTKCYTRQGNVPSGADQRLYDVGNLFFASRNASSASGSLRVEYEIELYTPQRNPAPYARFTGTSDLTAAHLVGIDAAYVTGSVSGWTLTDVSTLTCVVPGTYVFVPIVQGSSLAGTSIGGSGSATVASSGAPNSAGTIWYGQAVVTAGFGQTFEPALSSGTVTAVTWRVCTANPVAA
jgi:hypothetical protein